MIPQLCAPPPLAHNPRGLLNPHAYKKATYIKCNILPDIAEEMTSTEYNMKLCSRLWYYWMFTVYLPTSKSYLGIQLVWTPGVVLYCINIVCVPVSKGKQNDHNVDLLLAMKESKAMLCLHIWPHTPMSQEIKTAAHHDRGQCWIFQHNL